MEILWNNELISTKPSYYCRFHSW